MNDEYPGKCFCLSCALSLLRSGVSPVLLRSQWSGSSGCHWGVPSRSTFGTDAGSLSSNFSSFTNIPGPDGMSASWLPRRLAHTLCWRPQGQTLRPDGWGQKPGPKSWVIPVSHPQFAQVVSMKSIAFAKPPQLASHPRSQGWEGVDLIVRSLLKRGLGMRLAVLLTLGGGLSEWLAYQ